MLPSERVLELSVQQPTAMKETAGVATEGATEVGVGVTLVVREVVGMVVRAVEVPARSAIVLMVFGVLKVVVASSLVVLADLVTVVIVAPAALTPYTRGTNFA